MDDLFKWANKYSMLEDDVHAAIQQVLVTSRPARNDSAGNSKPLNQLRQRQRAGRTTTTKPSWSDSPQYLIWQAPTHYQRSIRFQMAKANQDGFKKTGSEQEMRLSQGSWSYHGTMQKSLLLGRKANKSRTLEVVRLLRRMMKCDGLRSGHPSSFHFSGPKGNNQLHPWGACGWEIQF